MAGKTVRVYEVLYNIDGPGPMGDGTDTRRFHRDRKAEAEAFAAKNRYYSDRAMAMATDAPVRVARRWGLD